MNRRQLSLSESDRLKHLNLVLAFALACVLLIQATPTSGHPRAEDVDLTLVGRVVNSQDIPINEAQIRVYIDGTQQTLTSGGEETQVAHTDDEGLFMVELTLDQDLLEAQQPTIKVEVTKPAFGTVEQTIEPEDMAYVDDHYQARLPNIVLPRILNPAFWVATAIFIVSFGLISFNILHETIAALLGAAAMLGVSYFIGSFNSDFWIIGFHRAITLIDFEVIFLLMTMMIFMGIMSETGVFQWLAFRTFQLGQGNAFLVTTLLVLITGVTSAVLNDTTVMLLMAPVSIQIALSLNIHPATIIVPEVLASNIGGAATLIGTPPNTIIGSYVGLGFNQFLVHMLPISIMGMAILLVMTRWIYRDEFSQEREPSSTALVEKLEADAQITDPSLLRKSLLVFGVTLILFFIEDLFHMPPAVVAIVGSSALLLWVRPDVEEMLHKVDWTTLVFFMSLFMMVGGVQEAGLIQLIAETVRGIAGQNLLVAMLLMVWVSALASALVANIPFTAAIVPVAVFLTRNIPGAENDVLYWSLALGAGLGGNATYIGSAPNIVAMGVLDRAGFRLKFADFSRVGVPVTFVTLLVPTLWIVVRYFWLRF